MNIPCETKDKCRLREVGMSMMTCAYYPPRYDGNGKNLNPDGNITSGGLRCETCKRSFRTSTQYGVTTVTEN